MNQAYDPRKYGAKCDECPLAGRKVVPPDGDSPIVIVGDSPGKQDEQFGKPFASGAGMKLAELLRRAGMPSKGQLRLTNAILCRPEIPDEFGKKRFDVKQYIAWIRKQNVGRRKMNAPLLNNPFDCCKPRLIAELKRAEFLARQIHKADRTQYPNGAVIFPTGNFALAQLMGVQKRAMKTMNYRGSVLRPENAELNHEDNDE